MVINRFIKKTYRKMGETVMNIKECYDSIGADFEDVLGRFGSEKLIERFALKFLDDDSYNNLKEALAEKNERMHSVQHIHLRVCA